MTELYKDKIDLTYLEWSKIRNSSGTAGSYLKASSTISGKKIYYKLSNYDSINGITGHESINEFIVDRLLNVFEFKHLHYDLLHALIKINGKLFVTYLCSSLDFKESGDSKIAFDVFYELERNDNESPLEFCKRYGFDKNIYEMLVIDYIILNRDRHGANIEVLRNSKNKSIRLAPLFDHGLSLLSPCMSKEEIIKFDVMEDKPVQSFFGTRSAKKNLELIPKSKLPRLPKYDISYKKTIFDGLDGIIEKSLEDKLWEMISKRWRYYESFCNKK